MFQSIRGKVKIIKYQRGSSVGNAGFECFKCGDIVFGRSNKRVEVKGVQGRGVQGGPSVPRSKKERWI